MVQKQGAGGSSAGNQGLLQTVMGFLYPTLKVMMEASIRRLTVTVKWKEGPAVQKFELVQYVTNPQRGGFINGVPAASGTAAIPGATAPATASTAKTGGL